MSSRNRHGIEILDSHHQKNTSARNIAEKMFTESDTKKEASIAVLENKTAPLLILFDCENIQIGPHYEHVKTAIIDKFGVEAWESSHRFGSYQKSQESIANSEKNEEIEIEYAPSVLNGADRVLVRKATSYNPESRVIIVSNDRLLVDTIKMSRDSEVCQAYSNSQLFSKMGDCDIYVGKSITFSNERDGEIVSNAVIAKYFDDSGYGFISYEDDSFFFHISEWRGDIPENLVGVHVSCVLRMGERGSLVAKEVSLEVIEEEDNGFGTQSTIKDRVARLLSTKEAVRDLREHKTLVYELSTNYSLNAQEISVYLLQYHDIDVVALDIKRYVDGMKTS